MGQKRKFGKTGLAPNTSQPAENGGEAIRRRMVRGTGIDQARRAPGEKHVMEAPVLGRKQSRPGQKESRQLLDRMPRRLAVPKLL